MMILKKLSVAAMLLSVGTAVASPAFVRSSQELLHFDVPSSGATLISIKHDAIASAVYDKSALDVQTESSSGKVFVLPRREGKSLLYITTESDETLALELDAQPDVPAAPIILKSRNSSQEDHRQSDSKAIAPLRAEGFSAEVKRFVLLALRGERSDEVLALPPKITAAVETATTQLKPLNVIYKKYFISQSFQGELCLLRNGSLKTIQIDPQALMNNDLLAVALSSSTLSPGESATVFFVEARAHAD
jgi:hypothetical protein